ncbi:hypothetical protein P7K49_002726 [Saguinus oedipus]|uniref:Clathrin/coatomer adaptor adaptin-like N-terminal domain-containing protein n=1 Tax=Saguinus oedipus TaxID=9490 RepID=A0ABQ9WI50_SAGOE|nr:hypothetical protein P7K49_002726 [Saguinus oedipus]
MKPGEPQGELSAEYIGVSGEIFELKAELNSDKKEKKKEAVKKVIASMTVGKDVRYAGVGLVAAGSWLTGKEGFVYTGIMSPDADRLPHGSPPSKDFLPAAPGSSSAESPLEARAAKGAGTCWTAGPSSNALFPDVVNCMQTDNLELKKLVYLYLMNYAKSQPDMAIMAVNTFVKVSRSLVGKGVWGNGVLKALSPLREGPVVGPVALDGIQTFGLPVPTQPAGLFLQQRAPTSQKTRCQGCCLTHPV